jgi:1-acyl-sn-glycerol-3-phosphate acyltransferase
VALSAPAAPPATPDGPPAPDRPRPSDANAVYRLTKSLVSAALRRCYRVDVKGLAHVPERGPMVLAANHRSFMDSIFLALVTPRPITFIAKAEYWDSWRTAWIFRSTGQIPLRRGSATGAHEAMASAGRILSGHGVIGIYPEGTRSRDGGLLPGNTGAARLALAFGAPIVPVGLIGTEAVQAPDESLPHLFRPVTVRFGPPHRLPAPEKSRRRKAELRGATDRLMHAIADLSGQEYSPDASLEHERGADV